MSFPKWLPSAFVSSGSPRWPLLLQEAKISEWSDSVSIQVVACALGLRACEILCVSFLRVECLFPQPSGSPIDKPRWSSKLDVPRACLSSAVFWAGQPHVKLQPLLLERTCAVVIIFSFVDHIPLGVSFTIFLPFLPIILWFVLYIFSCRNYSC